MPLENIDLAEALLIEVPPEALLPLAQLPVKRPGGQRMSRLKDPFVRILVSWFDGSDPRPYPFVGNRSRVLFWLLHLTRFGKKTAVLTTAIVERFGMSRWERRRHLERLEADGWICISRDGNKAVVVDVIIEVTKWP
jgi:hypothetical protein